MRFGSSLRVIGEEIFYLGVKVADFNKEAIFSGEMDKFKKLLNSEFEKEAEYEE